MLTAHMACYRRHCPPILLIAHHAAPSNRKNGNRGRKRDSPLAWKCFPQQPEMWAPGFFPQGDLNACSSLAGVCRRFVPPPFEISNHFSHQWEALQRDYRESRRECIFYAFAQTLVNRRANALHQFFTVHGNFAPEITRTIFYSQEW